MPLAGSEVYCKAANQNKDLISQAEKKIRDQREKIKQLELEIKQKKKMIKQQESNCNAVLKVDNTISADIKPFTIYGGGKKSRKHSYKNKSRKMRKNKSNKKSKK
jgi:hypothetical protein